jgi:hypothetical protein
MQKHNPQSVKARKWLDPASVDLYQFCKSLKVRTDLNKFDDGGLLGADPMKDVEHYTAVLKRIEEKHIKPKDTHKVYSVLVSHIKLVDMIKDEEASNKLNTSKSELVGGKDIRAPQFREVLLEERKNAIKASKPSKADKESEESKESENSKQ